MKVRFQGLEIGQSDPHIGDVRITSFDPGYPEVRTSDSPKEGVDGTVPGRDFLGSSILSFDIESNARNMVQAHEAIRQFLKVWRDESIRLNSGVLVPLEYQAADDPNWYRVYGRPRRASNPNFDVLMRRGRGKVSVEFEVMDVRTFAGGDAGLNEVVLRQTEEATTGGWTFPAAFPMAGGPASARREGALAIGGEVATPIFIEFHGPGRHFALQGNRGWHVGLRESVTLAHDQSITFDSISSTIIDNDGELRYGAADKRTMIDGVNLAPGMENVFLTGFDDTHTGYAVIRWRDAYASL